MYMQHIHVFVVFFVHGNCTNNYLKPPPPPSFCVFVTFFKAGVSMSHLHVISAFMVCFVIAELVLLHTVYQWHFSALLCIVPSSKELFSACLYVHIEIKINAVCFCVLLRPRVQSYYQKVGLPCMYGSFTAFFTSVFTREQFCHYHNLSQHAIFTKSIVVSCRFTSLILKRKMIIRDLACNQPAL